MIIRSPLMAWLHPYTWHTHHVTLLVGLHQLLWNACDSWRDGVLRQSSSPAKGPKAQVSDRIPLWPPFAWTNVRAILCPQYFGEPSAMGGHNKMASTRLFVQHQQSPPSLLSRIHGTFAFIVSRIPNDC
jgi:hypothetical protein